MRAKWIVLIVAVLAFSGVASASYLGTCAAALNNPGSVGLTGAAFSAQVLNNMGLAGDTCTAGDVLFSNFNYSTTGAETASTVVADFSDVTASYSGLALGASWGGANGGFSWSYTETICSGNAAIGCIAAPGTTVKSADAQESPADATASLTNTINGASANTSPGNLSIVLTQSAGTTTVNFSDAYTATTGTFLTGVTNDVYEQQSQVAPEPGSLLLMGGALIGLGLIGRKRSKKV